MREQVSTPPPMPTSPTSPAHRSITVQRLLAQQARQAGVSFVLADPEVEIPNLMLFSAGFAQPLISAYARLLTVLALGDDAQVLFPCEFRPSPTAALGVVCKEKAIDGSAEGLLRAAFLSRAAQEALGFSLFVDGPQQVDFSEVVRLCATPQTFQWKALHCQTREQWSELAHAFSAEGVWTEAAESQLRSGDVLQLTKT